MVKTLSECVEQLEIQLKNTIIRKQCMKYKSSINFKNQ